MHPKSKKQYFVGVDVGGSSIKFGVFECKACRGKHLQNPYDLRLVDKFSIPTMIHKKDNEKCLLNDIFIAIENYFAQVNERVVFDPAWARKASPLRHASPRCGLASFAPTWGCKTSSLCGIAELAHASAKDSADVGANYVSAKKDVQLAGIGFSVPGPVVDNELIHAININWKKKYDIVKATKKRFGNGIKVSVMNDANAAALAEYKLTLKGKCKSMCLITLGTGVGTGIVVNGKLVEGKSGIAGELAHVRVDYSKDAKKCSCGNVGCLETVVGSRGIISTYMKLREEGSQSSTLRQSSPLRQASPLRIMEIIDKAKKGNKIALATLDFSFDYLSELIAILMHVIEPEIVLIGGGISNVGQYMVKSINKHLKEKVFMTKIMPKIRIAKLRNDAGIYGAVLNLCFSE